MDILLRILPLEKKKDFLNINPVSYTHLDVYKRQDWGMVCYDNGTKKATLHLIHETKGGNDLALLRFTHEKRKIICAMKYFAEFGVDYDFTTGENPN